MEPGFRTRIVLQHRESHRYFSKERKWTEHIERAMEFPDTSAALDFARQENLFDVEILMTFGDPQLDIRLPIRR